MIDDITVLNEGNPKRKRRDANKKIGTFFTKRKNVQNLILVEYYDVNHPTPLDMEPDDCKA